MEFFTEEQIESFARDGFVKLTIGSREQGEAAQALLWEQIGLSPDEPEGWREPVMWASDLTGQGPFGELVRSPVLAAASRRGRPALGTPADPPGSPATR